jgi:hypothetical protein
MANALICSAILRASQSCRSRAAGKRKMSKSRRPEYPSPLVASSTCALAPRFQAAEKMYFDRGFRAGREAGAAGSARVSDWRRPTQARRRMIRRGS